MTGDYPDYPTEPTIADRIETIEDKLDRIELAQEELKTAIHQVAFFILVLALVAFYRLGWIPWLSG